ncbi:MAG: hypothetical protein VYA84_14255 [Planctomycetota bacterium]|nr:hypothetical protein [Planctomycetota bacterium]
MLTIPNVADQARDSADIQQQVASQFFPTPEELAQDSEFNVTHELFLAIQQP